MNVIIFGATGGVGQLAVKYALEKGYTVTGFVRTPSKMKLINDNLTLVQGDVMDAAGVSAAVVGHDAVICTIGGGTGNLIRANGTKNIIAGMKAADVNRLIVVSSMGVGESRQQLGAVAKFFIDRFIGAAIADHAEQEAYVTASNLDYTIVRPGGLGDDTLTGEYVVTDDDVKLKGGRVTRADVADFCVRLLEEQSFGGRALSIVGRQPHVASYLA